MGGCKQTPYPVMGGCKQIIVIIFRPSDSEIEKARKSAIRDKMTWAVIKEIFTYIVFLGVVGKLAYAEKDMHTYWFREDLVNMFKHAKYTSGGMHFDSVSCF